VADGDHLGRELIRLLSDPALLGDIARRCAQMMDANRGASKRTADVLVDLYREALAAREPD
jgi:hypothetical protein